MYLGYDWQLRGWNSRSVLAMHVNEQLTPELWLLQLGMSTQPVLQARCVLLCRSKLAVPQLDATNAPAAPACWVSAAVGLLPQAASSPGPCETGIASILAAA